GEEARAYLREMIECYTVPQGGFNLNYDYHRTGKGIAGPPVFCNESNSGYSAHLLEMLLQSYNGVIRIFPAVPRDWKDVSFNNLRAEGAFVVSASREGGKVREVRIRSERGGTVRLANPWRGTAKVISRGQRVAVRAEENLLSWDASAGETYRV